MNTENKIPSETSTRRKLLAGLGALSLFPILKFGFLANKKEVISCAPEAINKTMKMLTQDGRLVEVAISNIKGTKEKISNKQLQDWVKKEM
jgi:hypothetical protein